MPPLFISPPELVWSEFPRLHASLALRVPFLLPSCVLGHLISPHFYVWLCSDQKKKKKKPVCTALIKHTIIVYEAFSFSTHVLLKGQFVSVFEQTELSPRLSLLEFTWSCASSLRLNTTEERKERKESIRQLSILARSTVI